jgi:hypothetical protein
MKRRVDFPASASVQDKAAPDTRIPASAMRGSLKTLLLTRAPRFHAVLPRRGRGCRRALPVLV